MKKLLVIYFLFVSIGLTYAGGGWTQPKGDLYLKLGQYAILANNYYTPSGDLVDITTTGYYATSVYGEWGFSDKLTGIVYLPFFVRSTLNKIEREDGTLVEPGDEINSIGDVDVSIKYSLFQKGPYVSAISLTLGLPLGEPSGGTTELLQTGDGEFNQMISLDASRSFGQGNVYTSLLVAFNNRTNNFSDEFRYGWELGAKISSVWVIGRLLGIASFQNGDDFIVANNGIFSNNIEYLSFSPELAYDINNKVGVSLGAGFAFWGKRVLADPSYSLGVYFKL